MRASKYDGEITFTRNTVTGQNTYGEPVTEETEVVTLFAEVRPLQGREFESARQRWPEANYHIAIRRNPDITLSRGDTITWNGQSLDILDIQGPGTRLPEWEMIAQDHVV